MFVATGDRLAKFRRMKMCILVTARTAGGA
jgi:hypothetical protein